jgi:hypothetical protein
VHDPFTQAEFEHAVPLLPQVPVLLQSCGCWPLH